MGRGRAPGKVILLGEHFVVHGCPALAVPVPSRDVVVEVERVPGAWSVAEHARPHVEGMLRHLGVDPAGLTVRIEATLPFGAGMGGSAALAVALVRALGEADDEAVRAKAHELEKLAHGNPSGIDDTVATYAAPVRFVRGETPQVLEAPPLPLWIGGTPVGASTREAVANVGRFAETQPERFGGLLARARELVATAEAALIAGEHEALGAAMNDNHGLLQAVGVSTGALDALVEAARAAGAWGAKLTGGGLGGAMIALAPPDIDLEPALDAAGATLVIRP